MSNNIAKESKMDINLLKAKKLEQEKVTMLTAYDYTFASIMDEVGIDMILVGDSAANVIAGHSTTLPLTLDEIIFLAKGVTKAANKSFVVVDMPFGSYQVSETAAVKNAIRIIKETNADAVKLEGGASIIPAIDKIIKAGIPVMGHLGLTPQHINNFGSFSVRATENDESTQLIKDAKLLDKVGCFAMVLEKIPHNLAAEVTSLVKALTIGIGAGVDTDGQVLVSYDMLGMIKNFKPKFVREFAQLREIMIDAFAQYNYSVKNKSFPNKDEQY